MKGIFKNKFLLFSIVGGVIVFSIIAYVLLSVTATTKAVVFNSDVVAGTTITDSMVTEIDVPKDTPGEFYKTKSSVVGERTTANISKGQLIYPNNLMSSMTVKSASDDNSGFVTTTIKIPDDNALGGMLTAGDTVDISVVPKDGEVNNLAKALPGFSFDTSINGGVYFILSNVKILDSTTAVSSSNGTTMSATEKNDNGSAAKTDANSSYYLISLSYNDYKKLRIAEQYGTLYMSLVPKQNEENAPLLNEMSANVDGGLTDAQKSKNDNKDTNKTVENKESKGSNN